MHTESPTSASRRNRALILVGVGVGIGLGACVLLWRSQPLTAAADDVPTVETSRSDHRSEPAKPNTTLEASRQDLERRVAELEVKRLQERLAALESDQTAPAPQAPTTAQATPYVVATQPAAPASPSAEVSAGQRSLQFWNSLNDIMSREAAMRRPPAQLTAENAASFISSRGEADRFASGAIRQLDTTNVDPEIVALSQEIAGWYEEGTRLNDKAGGLLGSSDTASRRGAPGQAWRGGEEQHRKKCEDINRRGAQLRTRMAQKYKLPFPALQ